MEPSSAQRPKQYLRTDIGYNLHLVRAQDCDPNGMPLIHPNDVVPDDLVAWNASDASRNHPSAGIHFFLDDYRFEGVWNRPERYVDRISRYGCVLTPDFSLYRDMPMPMQMWNVYRSRAVGNYWQRMGLSVIPTLQWSTPDSYEFALAGLPRHSTVAVSTVGVRTSELASALWMQGMQVALDELEPSAVLLYGDPLDGFDFGDVEVTYYENKITRRFDSGRTRLSERI